MSAVAPEHFDDTAQDTIADEITTQWTAPHSLLTQEQKKRHKKNQQTQGHIQLRGMHGKGMGRVRPNASLVHMLTPGKGITREVYTPGQAGWSPPTTAVTQTPYPGDRLAQRDKGRRQVQEGQDGDSKDTCVQQYSDQAPGKAAVEDQPTSG